MGRATNSSWRPMSSGSPRSPRWTAPLRDPLAAPPRGTGAARRGQLAHRRRRGGVADELIDRIGDLAPHVVARPGTAYGAEGPGRYVLDPADPDQWARLLDEAFADAPPERVVQLSALDAPPVCDDRSAEEAARLCCLSTLHLVRALTEREAVRGPDTAPVRRRTRQPGRR
ncbi:hypothetical protein O1M54_46275 [Streptomyces diastatochromogenes]|nr:hypothetical protein [Streptomyces diastatochromogenes]